ncbi:AAA family ATPase [Vreelandella titanicae]|uniref:AAA family ATPase n=1 Tax=Vreelandella titanicae TaxID=664683 RepID=UPI001680C63A|nr:AAA family ATPase [Halomonas titanicae]QNU62498.1 AAA family ATPase [Halomonas titanicae]
MNHRFVLTGGPGGGKTTLLDAIEKRGYRVIPESARSIIKERLAAELSPRPDPVSFAQDILKSDIEKYRRVAVGEQATFFDRGVLDALYMLDAESALSRAGIANYVQLFPYNPVVFLLPPWEDIYGTDSERDQTFEESLKVFEGMKSWYSQWGYKTLEVPRDTIDERVKFVLQHVNSL